MSLSVIIADSLHAHDKDDHEGAAQMIQDSIEAVLEEPTTIRELLSEWEERKGFINVEDLTYADVALLMECLRSVLRGGEENGK